MARKRRPDSAGTLTVIEHRSEILKDNPLGDPSERRMPVWLPPAYQEREAHAPGSRFPVLFGLAGYGGSGRGYTDWRPFEESVPERAARLIRDGFMPPCILVFPDCFTALGGSQYLDSSAIGCYASYLVDELVPFVDREFRTLPSREHRGVFGKSSGGYGAMMHALRYPGTWGAVASHSGDSHFDIGNLCLWPAALNELARYRLPPRCAGPIEVLTEERGVADGRDDGRVARFLEHVWVRDKLSDAELHCLMLLCSAAAYDPDPAAPLGFRLPLNLETGEVLSDRWRRWQELDPINLVDRHAGALRSLRGIYVDCGWHDQYHIHFGTRILSKRLTRLGIAHRYEEFDDDHSKVDYRLEQSLPFLVRALD